MKNNILVFSFLVASIFVCNNIVASNHPGDMELGHVHVTLGNSNDHHNDSATSVQRFSYPRADFSFRNQSPSNDCIKIGVFCACLIGGSITCGVLYAPHTYRFYNKGSDSVNVHVGQSYVNAYDDDWMVVIKPGKHAVVHSLGKYHHASSAYTYHGTNREYATDKALENTYDFDISNNLAWSKHSNSRRLRSDTTKGNNVADSESFTVNFTADELQKIDKNIAKNKEYVKSYFRGTSIK